LEVEDENQANDLRRKAREWLLHSRRKTKTGCGVVTVPVSNEHAEVIAANPASVRLHARRADGVNVMMNPQRNENHVTVRYDLVREIDEHGRPVWDDGPNVVSDYHPWSGLRR
jgi:hypothetical protein